MKKIFAVCALLIAVTLPALAERERRLSSEDQSRFDSYYSRWQDYRRDNNRDQVRSMEERMQDIYRHYNIPSDVPFDRVASGRDHDRDRDRDRDHDHDHDHDNH